MESPEKRAKAMGLIFPAPPVPKASYVPVTRTGNLIYTAGMSSIQKGERKYVGRVGENVGIEEAYESARLCCINCLSAIRKELGSLDRISRIVKVNGYVRSARDFTQQHLVMNGASDLLFDLFLDRGKHARTAVGVNELPFGISVEVEIIAEVEKETGNCE